MSHNLSNSQTHIKTGYNMATNERIQSGKEVWFQSVHVISLKTKKITIM